MKKLLIFSLFGLLILTACDKNKQVVDINGGTNNQNIVQNDIKDTPSIDYNELSLSEYQEINSITPKEYILKSCLIHHYHQLGNNHLNDNSPFYYGFDDIQKISDFLNQEMEEYYKEVLPMYSENNTKYNAIFSRCLEFSNSKKVDGFLKKLNPKKCTKDDNNHCPENVSYPAK